LNRLIYFISLLALVGGCIKTERLEPFPLPDIVQTAIRRVECFEQYNTMLVASDRGLYLRFSDGDAASFESEQYDVLDNIDWTTAQVFYFHGRERFTVIEGSRVIHGTRTSLTTRVDQTFFPFAYMDDVMAPDGTIYRIAYYEEKWDGQSFYSDFYIGIYELSSLSSSFVWDLVETQLTVSTQFISQPYSTFDDNGDLVIATNPMYRVSNIELNNIVYDSVYKSGVGFGYSSLAEPIAVGNTIHGFDHPLGSIYAVSRLYSTEFSEGHVNQQSLVQNCSYPSGSNGPSKLLHVEGDTATVYVELAGNEEVGGQQHIGYYMKLNMKTKDCQVLPLLTSEYIKEAQNITDLDIMDGKAFVGTTVGLMVYDLSNDSVSAYARLLFEGERF